MKLGLVSDTHGRTDLVKSVNVLLRNRGLEALIHTGDVTRVSHIEPLLNLGLPLHLVFGNCDYNTEAFKQASQSTSLVIHGSADVFELGESSIGITHGHFDRNFDQLRNAEPDYIIHGHTHERRDERLEGIRYLNPGSVKPPNPSIAILDLESDSLEFLSLNEDDLD